MKLQDLKGTELTAKQRLAVSRQALILASKETIWRSATRLAKNSLLHFIESRGSVGSNTPKLDEDNSSKPPGHKL